MVELKLCNSGEECFYKHIMPKRSHRRVEQRELV